MDYDTEAELGVLFENYQKATSMQTTLEEMVKKITHPSVNIQLCDK